MNDTEETLPELSDEAVNKLQNIIITALKIKSGIPVKDVFIVATLEGEMSNRGIWSHEVTLNIPANLIHHLTN